MKKTIFTFMTFLLTSASEAYANINPNLDNFCPSMDRANTAQTMTTQQLVADGNLQLELGSDKSVVGLRVSYVSKCGLFDTIGLRSGDILLESDSNPLTSPIGAVIFFQQLKTSGSFGLKVFRSGRIKTLTVN